jgi:hypothetical protein
MDNILKLSGTIGLKIIQNSKINKKIFIFYDDHSNKSYCNKTKSTKFISELFGSIIDKDIALILEEPFMESDSKIKILWKDSEHLLLFRKFYSKLIDKCSKKKICKIFPFDIRLSILDISPDEINFNLDNPTDNYKINLITYFQNINYLFELNNYEPKQDSIVCFIKKVFDIYKKSKIYKSLKKRIIDFNEKYELYSNKKTIYDLIKTHSASSNFVYEEGYPFVNNHNDNFIDQLDKISSGIMELYSLILTLLLPHKNIVIYAGYYHSNNLAHIFEKYYNFTEEYSSGITEDINDKSHITNCIKINSDVMQFL